MLTPTDQVTYCERWDSVQRGPVGLLDVTTAQERDAAGRSFTVVLGPRRHPRAIIEMDRAAGSAVVWFFDEDGRRYLSYEFTPVSDTTMFMVAVKFWEYPDGAVDEFDSAISSQFVEYQRNGVIRQVARDFIAGEETVTDISDVPLDINWEKIPAFGDWASIAREDREIPQA